LVAGQPHPSSVTSSDPLLRLVGISKWFGPLQVLDGVNFELSAGETHVLAGENGAGKSTLIKILGGVHQAEAGRIILDGQPVRFANPREAAAGGVVIIHQELSLVPSMSVVDNIFLGRERSRGGWLLRRNQEEEARRVLGQLGLRVDVHRSVGTLPIAVQQMIEIGKALALQARVLVLDEPTSALSEPEVEQLFARMAELKAAGCGLIYITHKLEEVYRIADRITVLRDGRWVATTPAGQMPAPLLIRHMVGRDVDLAGARDEAVGAAAGPVALRVEDFSVAGSRRGLRPAVDRVTFDVRAGEVVGLAGLYGAGNSDLLSGLFGTLGRRVSGSVRLHGEPYEPTSPACAIRRGLALVTNDRQRTGLVLGLDVAANVTLASWPRVTPGGWLRTARELEVAARTVQSLRLRAASLRQNVRTLSGGNQQKVVLAKWLCTGPRVLLLDEPTRGVDVGSKQEIYALIREWSAAGHALLLITSEMPELLLLANRILVMHGGRITAAFTRATANQARILHAAMGGEPVD